MMIFIPVVLAVITSQAACAAQTNARDRPVTDADFHFSYHHSFRAPHITLGDENSLLSWATTGTATAHATTVVLTDGKVPNEAGGIWTTEKSISAEWEVVASVKIAGTQIGGGDGLALWYTQEGGQLGETFGAPKHWKGLGVFLDTFDNDGGNDGPRITAQLNDGTGSYDQATDGASNALGYCQCTDLRNNAESVLISVAYVSRTLTVRYDTTGSGLSYIVCLIAENVDIGLNNYFGASASSSGTHRDTHEIHALQVFELNVFREGSAERAGMSEAERTAALAALAKMRRAEWAQRTMKQVQGVAAMSEATEEEEEEKENEGLVPHDHSKKPKPKQMVVRLDWNNVEAELTRLGLYPPAVRSVDSVTLDGTDSARESTEDTQSTQASFTELKIVLGRIEERLTSTVKEQVGRVEETVERAVSAAGTSQWSAQKSELVEAVSQLLSERFEDLDGKLGRLERRVEEERRREEETDGQRLVEREETRRRNEREKQKQMEEEEGVGERGGGQRSGSGEEGGGWLWMGVAGVEALVVVVLTVVLVRKNRQDKYAKLL